MRRSTTLSYAAMLMSVAMLLAAMSSAPSGASSGLDVFYTLNADFDQGTLFNVNHTAPNSDQLQLDTQLTTFPVMWIANAGEDTLSKVDTNTGRELARYFTYAPRFNHTGNAYAGPAPSRTAVDSDGNAYVANRTFSNARPSVMKVLAEGYIDRNLNGVMDTSIDANNDGIIQPAEMKPMNDVNGNGVPESNVAGEIEDERIAWVALVGSQNGLGRSLCLDTDENLWVGMYNNRQYYKVSSVDGSALGGPVATTANHTPYGCAVDSNGMLWSASLGNTLGQLNTATGAWVATHVHNRGDYGIAIGKDPGGNVRVYQSDSGAAYHYFTPGPNTFTVGPGGMSSTGIAVDAANNIIAGQFGGQVRKHDVNNTPLWASAAAPGTSGSHGTIVDSNNDVWRINLYSNNMTKYDGATGALIAVYPIGNSPYTYSDATGLSARNNTTPSGTWTAEQDGGINGAIWDAVTWNTESEGATPAGSTITGRARSADVAGDLGAQPWTPITSGGALTLTGRFIQVEMKLTAGTDGATPVLSDVRIKGHSPNSPPMVTCSPLTLFTGPNSCSAPSASVGTASDPDGDPLTITQAPPPPYPVGTTIVTFTATDPLGATASCQAPVTVVDNQPPTISSVTNNIGTLWPPNHAMVPLNLTVTASDACGPITAEACSVTNITSNEAINSTGDGNTDPDWIFGNGLTASVRAERKGNGTGRIYTITVVCQDAAGNPSAPATTTVAVPHSQGRK